MLHCVESVANPYDKRGLVLNKSFSKQTIAEHKRWKEMKSTNKNFYFLLIRL